MGDAALKTGRLGVELATQWRLEHSTVTAQIQHETQNGVEPRLPAELLLKMHDLMLKARLLEERLIRMQKQGDGYFWIGGPGEEAFNTALGLLVNKGEGVDHDY